MSFQHLKRRVERGEALVEGRVRQASACQARLQREWRQAWTPLRIVASGLGMGFITGRLQPEQAIGKIGKVAGPGTLQLLTSVIGLVGAVQAAFAASAASDAAESAEDTADAPEETAAAAARQAAPAAVPPDAAAAARPVAAGSELPRRRDESWNSQPSPAEAATEISER